MHHVLKKLVPLCVEGAKVLDICVEGDKLLEQGTGAVYNKSVKGTKVSKGTHFFLLFLCTVLNACFYIRSCVPYLRLREQCGRTLLPTRVRALSFPISFPLWAHTDAECAALTAHYYRSDPLSAQTLAAGDVVKLHLGAHIDGFASISAETLVVGASAEAPVTGRRADALQAAWTAAEVAMRLVKVGNKNWAVTEAVGKTAAAFGCKPVEGARIHLALFFRSPGNNTLLCVTNRHAFVPANTERDRRQKENHLEPIRGTEEGVRDDHIRGERSIWSRCPHLEQ